jgi:hypothetical protein
MTDEEMTKLCAEAMGWTFVDQSSPPERWKAAHYLFDGARIEWACMYDPLNSDKHAMALVKKFNLCIDHNDSENWNVCKYHGFERPPEQGWNPDLNRAIVECVAEIQTSNLVMRQPQAK